MFATKIKYKYISEALNAILGPEQGWYPALATTTATVSAQVLLLLLLYPFDYIVKYLEWSK